MGSSHIDILSRLIISTQIIASFKFENVLVLPGQWNVFDHWLIAGTEHKCVWSVIKQTLADGLGMPACTV